MTNQEIISETISFVKMELKHAEGGHDWWHIQRVWVMAKEIAKTEKVDIFIVELGALLHDIADAKFNCGDDRIGIIKASNFLYKLGVSIQNIEHIAQIIKNVSFSGGNTVKDFFSTELAVVQDADRLDAIGAIGIARAFNYGGFTRRELYNPSVLPIMNMNKEQYRKSTAPTLNHLYEKLLLLKDKMNTDTAKKIAIERHNFMLNFLEQFYNEWDGKK